MRSWVMYPPRGAGQGQSPTAGKAWVSHGNAVPGSCRGRAWWGRPRSLSPDLHSRLLSFGLPGRHCLSCHRCIPVVTTLLSLMLVSGIHAGLCAVCTGPRHLWPLGAKTGRWNGWVEEQTTGQLEHGPGAFSPRTALPASSSEAPVVTGVIGGMGVGGWFWFPYPVNAAEGPVGPHGAAVGV